MPFNPFDNYLQARDQAQRYRANEDKIAQQKIDTERSNKAFTVLQGQYGDVAGDPALQGALQGNAQSADKFAIAKKDKERDDLIDGNKRLLLGAKTALSRGMDTQAYFAAIPPRVKEALGFTPDHEKELVDDITRDPAVLDSHLAMLDKSPAAAAVPKAVGRPFVAIKDGKRIFLQSMSDGTQKEVDGYGAPDAAQGNQPASKVINGQLYSADGRLLVDATGAAYTQAAQQALGANLGKTQAAAVAGLPGLEENFTRSTGAIDAVLNNPNLDSVLGAPGFEKLLAKGGIGGLTKFAGDFGVAPGSPAAEAASQLDFLNSQTFLQGIQQMRGLGALSDKEGAAVQQAVTNLSRLRQPAAIRGELVRLRGSIARLIAAARREAGGGNTGITAAGPNAPRAAGVAPRNGAAPDPKAAASRVGLADFLNE